MLRLLSTPLPSDRCWGCPVLRSEPRTTSTTPTPLLSPSSLTARFAGRKLFDNSVLFFRMKGVWVLICPQSLHWTMATEGHPPPRHLTPCTVLLLLLLQWRILFVLTDIQLCEILTLWQLPLPVNMTVNCCSLSSPALSTDTRSLSSGISLNPLHQTWLNSVKLRRSCSSTI